MVERLIPLGSFLFAEAATWRLIGLLFERPRPGWRSRAMRPATRTRATISRSSPIDNESVIGFFRPDGTAKPDLRIVPALAEFFEIAAPLLDDFEPDPVVLSPA